MIKSTIYTKGVSFVMVPVEGGKFLMGSSQKDAWDNEKPVHQVVLSDYYMSETVVTNKLWQAVMEDNEGKNDDMPVTDKNWKDCMAFIEKLNALTGLTFRLPTEAEWENAARGGHESHGYPYSGGDNLNELAWFDSNSGGRIHPVRQKQPNELGLYDMSGNIWEWCSDWYGEYDSNNEKVFYDPKGPAMGSQHVVRGASSTYYARSCRVSCRMSLAPSGENYTSIGFRLAMNGDACLDKIVGLAEEETLIEPEDTNNTPNYPMEEEINSQPAESNVTSVHPMDEEAVSQSDKPNITPDFPIKEETAFQPAKSNVTPNHLRDENAVRQPAKSNTNKNDIPVQPAMGVPEKGSTDEITLVDGVDYNKAGVGWLIAAIIFTITGGWLAIVSDIVLLGNISLNGQKYHKYRKSSRIVAIISLCLTPISILLWNLAML